MPTYIVVGGIQGYPLYARGIYIMVKTRGVVEVDAGDWSFESWVERSQSFILGTINVVIGSGSVGSGSLPPLRA